MTIGEILNIIHEERVELEVLESLQRWMLQDRKEWISRAMDSEATVRAIHSIATRTENKEHALKGIINLSSED